MQHENPSIPRVVDDCHELLKWLIPQLDKFPRNRRFTLGERIERGMIGSAGSERVPRPRGTGLNATTA